MIFLPLIYGAMGFVFGSLMAFIYNFAAKYVGGIEIEFEEVKAAPAPLPN